MAQDQENKRSLVASDITNWMLFFPCYEFKRIELATIDTKMSAFSSNPTTAIILITICIPYHRFCFLRHEPFVKYSPQAFLVIRLIMFLTQWGSTMLGPAPCFMFNGPTVLFCSELTCMPCGLNYMKNKSCTKSKSTR